MANGVERRIRLGQLLHAAPVGADVAERARDDVDVAQTTLCAARADLDVLKTILEGLLCDTDQHDDAISDLARELQHLRSARRHIHRNSPTRRAFQPDLWPVGGDVLTLPQAPHFFDITAELRHLCRFPAHHPNRAIPDADAEDMSA